MTSQISQDSDASCAQALSLDDTGADQTPRLHFRGKGRAQQSGVPNPFDSYEDSPAPASTCSSENPPQTTDPVNAPNLTAHTSVTTSGGEQDVISCRPLFASPRTWASVAIDTLVFAWVILTHMVFTAWPYTSLYFLGASGACRIHLCIMSRDICHGRLYVHESS